MLLSLVVREREVRNLYKWAEECQNSSLQGSPLKVVIKIYERRIPLKYNICLTVNGQTDSVYIMT